MTPLQASGCVQYEDANRAIPRGQGAGQTLHIERKGYVELQGEASMAQPFNRSGHGLGSTAQGATSGYGVSPSLLQGLQIDQLA